MQKLYIPSTKTTFEVNFDAANGIFDISGVSYPSDAFSFFQPLIRYLFSYLNKVKTDVLISFRISYINTSSSKYLFDILEIFDQYHKSSKNVRIRWIQSRGDDELLDIWKEFSVDFDIPHEVIFVE